MISNSNISTIILILGISILFVSCTNSSLQDNSSGQSISSKTEEQNVEISIPRKKSIFNDVSLVQSKLGSVGIGKFKSWRNDNDGYGWGGATPYYWFGSESSTNGLQNNLAYYIRSQNKAYIESIIIMLNINNKTENNQALSLFEKITKKTFSSLELELPNGLTKSIKSKSNFSSENNDFKVTLKLHKDRIDWWKLTIETK